MYEPVDSDVLDKNEDTCGKLHPPVQRSLRYHLYTIWLVTYNDLKSIIGPQTAVGIFGALAGSAVTTNSTPALLDVLSRIPSVILWNWLNLFVFNLANQRLPNSIIEDRINKPWRPIAQNRMSPVEARRLLLFVIAFEYIVFYFYFGVVKEAAALTILSYMYNELSGADENYIVRNLINAAGFIGHSAGSTLVAAGRDERLNDQGQVWMCIIGAVIFSTLQAQDLADMEGDAERDRRTIPLVHGETVGRWSVAITVAAWSVLGPWFWELGVLDIFRRS